MLRDALSVGRRHGAEFLVFAGATGLYQVARFTFSLAAAQVLLPAAFSIWALVIALLVYAPSVMLGVANGMNRELPLLTGAGREVEADRAESTTWLAALLSATVLGVVLAACALVVNEPWLALLGVLAAGTVVYHTQQLILRSRLRFTEAGLQHASVGAALLIGTIVVASLGSADLGLVLAFYAGALAVGVVAGLAARVPTARLERAEVARLALIGFPIMLAGLAFSLLVTIDRWVGVTLLGLSAAAPYALASVIGAAMLVVPAVIAQQVYPRMAIACGRGASDESLRAMAFRQGLVAAGLAAPLAVAVALFAILTVPKILPAYETGVPAIVILALGLVVLSAFTGYGNYLNVTGGHWLYLAVQVSALVMGVVLMAAGGLVGGVTGIAAGAALTHMCYGLIVLGAARRWHRPNPVQGAN